MSVLRLALPAVLLLYFAGRSLRQRVFLLGIPFLMYMASSVFFDKLKPFYIPGRLEPADHVMMWLVIVWLLFFELPLPLRLRRPGPKPQLFGPRLSSPEELVLAGLALLVLVEIVLSVAGGVGPMTAVGQAKGFIYLFVGYLLLRGMLAAAGREDTLDFVAALVVVDTIAAGLFVLHQGLHLPIYEATEYQTITFMGQQLTRSFYFMPQFLVLAIAYCLARPRWSLLWGGVFLVTVAALWVSYTRSLLVIAVVEAVVILGLRLAKGSGAAIAVRRALAIAAVVAVVGVVAYVALPVQSEYFLSRIGMATSSGSLTGDPNLQNREQKITTVYHWIRDTSTTLGVGFAGPFQDGHVDTVETMSSDLVWVPTLYRLGVLGVVALLALYAAAIWRAALLAVRGAGDAETLALVLLGTLAGTLLEGFVSWTVLNPERYPMGLWLFALLAAEAVRRRAEAVEGEGLPAAAEAGREALSA